MLLASAPGETWSLFVLGSWCSPTPVPVELTNSESGRWPIPGLPVSQDWVGSQDWVCSWLLLLVLSWAWPLAPLWVIALKFMKSKQKFLTSVETPRHLEIT